MLLPVGELSKEETRQLARELGLRVVSEKPESQDICFVPDGDHSKVIARHLGADAPALSPGDFVTADGSVVGRHDGYARFTIGQRRGLPGGSREAMFVIAIHPETREVVIGTREELLGRGVIAREINWLVDDPPAIGSHVQLQVRHRATAAPAEVLRLDGDEIELALDEPIAAITPGQSLVIYDAERVLGGGIIESALGARGTSRASLPVLAA